LTALNLSNEFLDWYGQGHLSAIEQIFNPAPDDIARRRSLGIFTGKYVF